METTWVRAKHCIMAVFVLLAGRTASASVDYMTEDLRRAAERIDEADRQLAATGCTWQVPVQLDPPVIGLPSNRPVERREFFELRRLPEGSLAVSEERLRDGKNRVPIQQDSWSCGVNSSARFAAMLGAPVENYHYYHALAPYYGGYLGIPRVGGNPEMLQDYLRSLPGLASFSISQRCTRVFHPQWEILLKALSMGRPVLVLFMDSGTSLHWVNVVARNSRSGNWYYMETDVWELPGGDDALRNRMNNNNCAAQRFGYIERFNSISSTVGGL